MNIIEQIKALPDEEYHGLESPDGHDLRSRDLKALAESHEQLLKVAKYAGKEMDRLGGRCNPIYRAIAQAEKLYG